MLSKNYALYGYILDPHGAVGYLGLMDYFRSEQGTGILLETAHPVKFKQTVEDQILRDVPVPAHVEKTSLEKRAYRLMQISPISAHS